MRELELLITDYLLLVMSNYYHFYELPVYKKCRAFRKKVSAVTKKHFPVHERFHLSAQLLDAARSVTANIAEGFGRFHYQENIQFCRQSRGSLSETMEHLITAYDEGYINKDELQEVHLAYRVCLKELNLYLQYLKNAKQHNNQ